MKFALSSISTTLALNRFCCSRTRALEHGIFKPLAQMRMIDGFVAGRRFIAGERYTIADITAMVALGLGVVAGLTVDPGLANLTRWYGEVSARPSARA